LLAPALALPQVREKAISGVAQAQMSGSAAADEVPPRARKRAGVTLLKRDKCDDSYRLYSSRGTEVAHIIDLDGRDVHKWSYPQGHTWHLAEMLPNGHLIAIIKDVMILNWIGTASSFGRRS